MHAQARVCWFSLLISVVVVAVSAIVCTLTWRVRGPKLSEIAVFKPLKLPNPVCCCCTGRSRRSRPRCPCFRMRRSNSNRAHLCTLSLGNEKFAPWNERQIWLPENATLSARRRTNVHILSNKERRRAGKHASTQVDGARRKAPPMSAASRGRSILRLQSRFASRESRVGSELDLQLLF